MNPKDLVVDKTYLRSYPQLGFATRMQYKGCWEIQDEDAHLVKRYHFIHLSIGRNQLALHDYQVERDIFTDCVLNRLKFQVI